MDTSGPSSSTPEYTVLSLADGRQWVVSSGNESARAIVVQLADAMRLQRREVPPDGARFLYVVVHGRDDSPGRAPPLPADARFVRLPVLPYLAPASGQDARPVVCTIDAELCDSPTLWLQWLSLVVACDVQARGGTLLHAALAERDGCGVLLAGPGEVGKSTASNRLPRPWRALCDDTTLVVRDARGLYWAHPWPTWSRFFFDGPGDSWDVQHGVLLRAIFFLEQAGEDRVEPIGPGHAVTRLLPSAVQVSGLMTRYLNDQEARDFRLNRFDSLSALARSVPAYSLQVSLSGAFWREMERALDRDGERGRSGERAGAGPAPQRGVNRVARGAFFATYTGPSMNPTLREPEMMEILPYGDRPVRAGDVVFCRPPEAPRSIVHRVIGIAPAGIRTRGDNNSDEDGFTLQPAHIDGRVVAGWRGQRRRRILGGWCGRLVGGLMRCRRLVDRAVSRLLHAPYHAMTGWGLLRRLLPARLRPRVVAYQTDGHRRFHLLLGKRVVGWYDVRQRCWHIRRPYRLLVDEGELAEMEANLT